MGDALKGKHNGSKEIVMEMCKKHTGTTMHFGRFKTLCQEAGATMIRESWLRESGAKTDCTADNEILNTMRKGKNGYNSDQLKYACKWTFI